MRLRGFFVAWIDLRLRGDQLRFEVNEMISDVAPSPHPSPSHTKTYKKSKKYIKSKKQAYNRYIADAIGEMREMEYTIKKSRECEPNAVIVNGQEVGSVQWSGCYYTKRGRSQGYWYIVGNEDAMVPNHTEKFKTMKSAAESLVASWQV